MSYTHTHPRTLDDADDPDGYIPRHLRTRRIVPTGRVAQLPMPVPAPARLPVSPDITAARMSRPRAAMVVPPLRPVVPPPAEPEPAQPDPAGVWAVLTAAARRLRLRGVA